MCATPLSKRSAIIREIRKFLDGEGFMEVETPILVSNAGGAAARPFETHFNALNEDLKMRISLELYLKRLIVGGLERVYEIGRVFRNEGVDTRHNPEFTLMELYQAYTDYHGMMDLTERMYRHVAEAVLGTTKITYNGIEMDLSKPFTRITMVDAVKQYSGVDFKEIHTLEEARAAADAHEIEYEERHKKGDILNLFFEAYVEEHLIQPTFVMDHPIEISPLTKKKPEDPDYVERFEFFMNGWETGKRLFRAERPHRPACPLCRPGGDVCPGRRGSQPYGRGLLAGTGDRYAPYRRHRLRHRPDVYAADR